MKKRTLELVETTRSLEEILREFPTITDDPEAYKAKIEEVVYQVVKAVNTVEFNIGQKLTHDEVDALCEGETHQVIIKAKS